MTSTVGYTSEFKVYVSYCDTDFEFAEKLIQGLSSYGNLEIAVAPEDTAKDQVRRSRVRSLIAEADAVVFVLSPDSARTCNWEISYALELSKQIQSVVCRPLHDTYVPAGLAEKNQSRIDGNLSNSATLGAIASQLTSNSDWIREHTRLLVRAREWDMAGRPSHLLLTGNQIVEAKIWALSRPDDAPTPTDLHVTFVCVSEAVGTAKELAQADLEEAETIAMMQSSSGSSGFRRWANQAFMMCGYALVILTLVSSSTYVVAKCTQPTAQSQASFVLPLQQAE